MVQQPTTDFREGYVMGDEEYTLTETITPPLAEEYLRHNYEHNRAIGHRDVNSYAGMMVRGEWILTHQGIAFDKEGNLIDGQHRLLAIVLSDSTIRMRVTRNADPAIVHVVDGGRKRSLKDSLQVRGEKQSKNLAAVVSAFYKLQVADDGRVSEARNAAPERVAGLKLLESHPGLREAVFTGDRCYRAIRFPKGMAAALYYDLSSVDSQEAEVFFEYLITGAGLSEGDPIFTLRNKVINAVQEKPRRGVLDFAAWTRKAWNNWLAGEQMRRVYWSPGGKKREGFPRLRRP